MLEREFKYYLDNQKQLVDKYNGKFLLIVGEEIQGVFDSKLDAYNIGKENFKEGTFLIQRCSPGNVDYSQTFHSRVSF